MKIVSRSTVLAEMVFNSRVVLAYSRPLPLSSIRSIFLPVLGALTILLQTLLLDTEHFFIVDENHRGGLTLPGSLSLELGVNAELDFLF